MKADALKARIERILKSFQSEDMKHFVSGINDAGSLGAIDDGSYGDPQRDTTPDFVKKDNDGWRKLW